MEQTKEAEVSAKGGSASGGKAGGEIAVGKTAASESAKEPGPSADRRSWRLFYGGHLENTLGRELAYIFQNDRFRILKAFMAAIEASGGSHAG